MIYSNCLEIKVTASKFFKSLYYQIGETKVLKQRLFERPRFCGRYDRSDLHPTRVAFVKNGSNSKNDSLFKKLRVVRARKPLHHCKWVRHQSAMITLEGKTSESLKCSQKFNPPNRHKTLPNTVTKTETPNSQTP